MTRDDARTTYRYLRIAMPLLVVLLAASVAHQVFATDPRCWLGSISAYYYTPARPVLVAALCALGACLVIYRGSSTAEDLALTVSGFLAFVVALVPTPLRGLAVDPDEVVGPSSAPRCGGSYVPSDEQLAAAVANNVWALLVTAAAALVVAVLFHRRTHGTSTSRPILVLAVALALGTAAFVLDPALVRAHGHLVAALGMFAGFVAVVLVNAFSSQALALRFRVAYLAILAGMLLAGLTLGPVALLGWSDHAVFWLEGALIGLFACFWVVQTVDLWGTTTRAQRDGAARHDGRVSG